MYHNSRDKKGLTDLYDALVDASGNDRARLFNSSLATAVNEIKSGSSDKDVKFWVLVANPSDEKHQLKLYMSLSRNKTTAKPDDDVNCMLRDDRCVNSFTNPLYDKRKNFDLVVAEQQSDSDIIGKSFVDVEARSWKAVGLGLPNETGGEIRSLALLGGKAAGRVKMDPADILRISFVKSAR